MQIKNVRFLMAAITTFSAYAVYVSRVNLSIAIIAMVDDSHQQQQQQLHASPDATQVAQAADGRSGQLRANFTLPAAQQTTASTQPPAHDNHTAPRLAEQWAALQASAEALTLEPQQLGDTPFAGSFPASKKSILKPPLISQEKFHWDQTEQGHILGAFFYGYILFQIPGARMAESVGARWILMAATAGSAIISLVFPLSTQLNSIHLLMVLRFAMGLCQSAFFPAAYVFFCRWLPEAERSVLLPIMFIGSNMGSISTYIMSSYLISSSYGWPSVFYVAGLINLLGLLLWFVFGSNGPQDNWLITSEERDYITKNLTTNGGSASVAAAGPPAGGRPGEPTTRPGAGLQPLGALPAPAIKCDKRSKLLSKSKSANDLIPANQQQQQQQVQLSFHPEVTMLEQSGCKTTGTLAGVFKQSNNNNNNNCCQPEAGRASGEFSPAHQPGQLSWLKLLASLPVWVFVLSMYGNEWSQVVLTYELPTYLNTALSFPIEQNGVINSFFQLSYTVASPILSSLGAYLLESHLLGMRKIHVRKLFQSLALFGQLACFVSVPVCGANRGLIIMFMFSATVFKACANGGDIMVPGDLSPEYAGTIFAFANSIGNTAGFFVPLFAAFIVNNAYERDNWTPFWMTTAAIMGFSGTIFLVFGETGRQDFSAEETTAAGPKATKKEDVEARPSWLATAKDGQDRLVAARKQQPPIGTAPKR